MTNILQDAVIIGGGFYGSTIASYLTRNYGLSKVIILEREPALMRRASFANQARVHNGYHYPRSFTTAYRSRVNLPKFVRDWPETIKSNFTNLYAIAQNNSKVTAKQFLRFCNDIGAGVKMADSSLQKLFESRLINAVFCVDEYVFDSSELVKLIEKDLKECGVEVLLNMHATSITKNINNNLIVSIKTKNGKDEAIKSRLVFNCTYSGLNQIQGDFPGVQTSLKHEITEMGLIDVPEELKELGVTVMDGSFFSIMPFPARQLHTLSHVRYTPHLYWNDKQHINPYIKLDEYVRQTRVDRMFRDVSRYLPIINKSKYVDSLFEVKTVLKKNESDDGRPILFEQYSELPGCYSVLGGKIDNIYDVFDKIDSEVFKNAYFS